jgi:hypothetical protein
MILSFMGIHTILIQGQKVIRSLLKCKEEEFMNLLLQMFQ